jgi:MFS family permease
VQVVTAPIAILADALSFVVSAVSLALIHTREESHSAHSHSAHSHSPALLSQLRDGLRAVLRHPLLRPLAATSGLFNLFDSMLIAFYALYLTRVLGASAALSGVILVLSGLVGLVGVALARPLPRRFGLGRTMVAAICVAGGAELVIGLAHGPLLIAAGMVVVGEGLVQAAASVYGINGVTLRQALVPDRLQGRVNATMQVISVGAAPLGAIAATELGALYGVRPVVLLAGIGTLLAFLVVLFSPVRTLDRHPDAAEEAAFAR